MYGDHIIESFGKLAELSPEMYCKLYVIVSQNEKTTVLHNSEIEEDNIGDISSLCSVLLVRSTLLPLDLKRK